jgi:hypothetical protein
LISGSIPPGTPLLPGTISNEPTRLSGLRARRERQAQEEAKTDETAGLLRGKRNMPFQQPPSGSSPRSPEFVLSYEGFPSAEPPRRGKSRKYYGVRVGRTIGVFDTWVECQSVVNGIRAAEFRSFYSFLEARDYVMSGRNNRKICYMTLAHLAPALAPTSFQGGRALRATLRVLQEGETHAHEFMCCLDSGSDVNLANRSLLHDVHPVEFEEIAHCGVETQFTEEGTLRVLLRGDVVEVPALVAVKEQLPHGCAVLLGVPGVDDLGVRLDAHRAKRVKRLECNVGEKTLRTWLEANGVQKVAKVSFDVNEVDVNPELPDALQARVRSLLKQYEDVFAGLQDSLPKPFATDPVELKFVDNPEPQSIPEPRWTFAQKQGLTSWAEEGLKNGSLELSTSRWASRPHIVMKTPAHTHKDLIDIGKCKLSVCGDYRMVNKQILKIVPNLPNGLEEVERAAGHEYYWETDAVACYLQFVLAHGRSREALAVWSPVGLVQPTTLPFGQRNSGTEAQGPYRAVAAEMNPGRHGNYVDDWIGYSNSLEQLTADFEVFLRVCRKYSITLGPPKTRFGYKEAQFFGFRVNKLGFGFIA